MKTEMEPNISLNTKPSFLPGHDRLKKFTIPKRTPDKDFLTDCSTNQRDYHEVIERLTQSCFDRECNLASLWHFDKIEMVHNKELEEEFVAKRMKMREQGRTDKELSSFLVVSKEEVLKICQSGLRTSNSIKKELHIMRELGNPQLGVYLFRHVDIALNYASKHSVPVENIIIFRVLLGRVKKINPPKGKKKVPLDPTPNYDSHVSRIHPSLKDSIEDQAISSLVYFYEYSELSKPVDKPRQCLPHAVVKVKCINQKVRADYPIVSLKSRPKRFSKGRGQGLLLENCTVVTRIGNSKLIYEHFHRPKNCGVSDNLSVEVSESAPNWNGSAAETQGSKVKHKLPGRWDSTQVEADVQNFPHTPDVDCNRDGKSNHMESSSKNPNDSSVNYSELSTIITSKTIKDPRLTKKERNLVEQNGEPVSHGIVQLENELKYKTEMKMPATFDLPWPDPEELFLLNDSWHTFSEEQSMAKTPWKDRFIGEHRSPLRSNDKYLVNNEHPIVNVKQLNREILDSQNIDTHLAVKCNLSHSSLKSADCGIKTATQSFAQRDKTVKYSKPLLGQNKNSVNTNCVVSSYISNGTYTHNREQPVLATSFQINTRNQNLERAAADKDEMDGREEMYSQFQDDNGYSSEAQCSASSNHCTLRGDGETLQPRFHSRMHLPESLRDDWTEDNGVCEWSAGDQVHAEIFKQELQEMAHTGKSSMNKISENTNRQIPPSSERTSSSICEKEENTSKQLEERTDNVKDWMDSSHILGSENLATDFNLNFQVKCSLTEPQLIKTESGKEKLGDLPDPALLTKCIGLTTEDPAFMLLTSTPVPLGCVKDTEIKHPQSENTSHSTNEKFGVLNNSLSCNDIMPEIFEHELAVNTPDLIINNETEFFSEGYKKYSSISQKLCSHIDVSSEDADSEYQYLQERMDWENLLAKPSPDTEISGSTSLKDDKNECSCDGKIELGKKATKKLNIYVRPDLQITVANTLANCKLESHIENKGDMTHSTTCFLNDNESHSGSLDLDCSVTSAFISDLSCRDNNKRVKIIEHEISEKSTSEDTLEFSDMKPASGESRLNSEQNTYANVVSENNVQEHFIPIMGNTKQELSSEANKNIVTSKNISKHLHLAIGTEELSLYHTAQGADEDACESDVNMSTGRLATSVQRSLGKLKPAKTDDISKFQDTFSDEKEAVEIFPAQQRNISMSVDSAQACDLSYALVPVVKNRHDTRDPQVLLTPQINGSGIKTMTNNSSKRNLEEICSEKPAEQQELYKNNKYKLLAKHIIQPEKNTEILNGYLTQTSQVTCSKQSTNTQTSPTSTKKVGRCHSASPLRGDSKQGVITASMILPCACDNVLPNKKYQKDRGLSSEHSNSCKNITSDTKLQVEIEQTALDFVMEMSEILQKADETSCLNVLQELIIVCKNILPLFIRAFEEKQDCCFEHVLVSRENAEASMRAKLKPCAIEPFVELQIIMETIEFMENKRRYLQDKHTFRSLLWFDDSLCIELFGGQSGYQQQSNFYPAFQRSLKYNALNELQSHHKKLVDKFEITRLENQSYYCLLKLRREIRECQAAVNSNSFLSDFFLSEPYVCGANYGDTIEDLENARKSIVDLINTCLSGIPLGTEKLEHLGIIMDIISTKIEFIRTCDERKIKSSFIGLEHIFFNAAVCCILSERSIFVNGDFKSGEGQMLKIYEAALPKLYEIYEDRMEKLERNFNCASEEHILRKSIEKPCNCEKVDGGANYDIRNYLVSYPEICVGEILDEAQSVNLEKLRQHLCRCTEHLEVLKKYFQIIQEVDVDCVLITKENVLNFMESSGLRAIRLKPEAVEVYTDLAMVHETLCFLQNSIARKEDKPRFRSLLWCDLSLVNELFCCQQKMASFSYRKDNPLEITESAISDLQDELNVVYDYAESLNCSYARQLLTRELEELLETRKYLQTSVSSICMCVDLVPYTIALNYGSNISELEYNYQQFYLLFEKLLLADRKDLGKMAHVMKILKTIEHMKFICAKQQKPPLHLVICQMLKNWRKSRQLKKQEDMKRHVDANGSNSTKHKRPAGITSEDNFCDHEDDPSDNKKKKVVASLMTTKKKQEKERRGNVRKGARPKPLEREELQVRISTDSTWNKKDKCLRDRPSLSPSHSKGLKAADSLDYIDFSPNASSPALVNSNMLDSQKNQTDLKDFNNNWRDCSKENNQECFAPCDERGKGTSVSPKKDPSPQNPPEDSFTSVAKLSCDSSVLPTLNQYHDVKPGVTGNVSGLIPSDCTTIPLELDRNGEMYEKKIEANCALAYNSDSSAIPELNKFMELESLCSDPFSTENTQTSAECSAFSQNEHTEETPHIHSYSVHSYRTFYPSYSWYFCQTSSSYQVTQMYQEFSSYEMHQLTPTMLTATSMVYNTQSSTFCSQSCSHFGVGESQRVNFAQTYPVHSYFNSTMPFPYSYQQWPSWYTERPSAAQAAYPYSSNAGL